MSHSDYEEDLGAPLKSLNLSKHLDDPQNALPDGLNILNDPWNLSHDLVDYSKDKSYDVAMDNNHDKDRDTNIDITFPDDLVMDNRDNKYNKDIDITFPDDLNTIKKTDTTTTIDNNDNNNTNNIFEDPIDINKNERFDTNSENNIDTNQVANSYSDSNQDLKSDSDSDSDSDDNENWDTVQAIASYNVYNDKGELEILKYDNSHKLNEIKNIKDNSTSINSNINNNTSNNNFDYTKVSAEDQAQRSYRTNKKTDFLFNHKNILKYKNSSQLSINSPTNNHDTNDNDNFNNNNYANSSSNPTTNSASTINTSPTPTPTPTPTPILDDQFYDEFEDDVEKTDDLNLNSQLNITRLLLDDMEKIAYAASINVLINSMCTDLATLSLCIDNITSHKKLANRLNFTQKDMANWKTIILQRLYNHLNITEDEITMIEKLSFHNIELADLVKSLRTTQDIHNPWDKTSNNDTSSTTDSSKNTGTSDKTDASENQDDIDLDTNSGNNSQDITENEIENDTKEDLGSGSENESELRNTVPKEIIDPNQIKDQKNLQIDVAWTIVCDLFLILLENAIYDSRSRTLLIKFADLLNITHLEICEFEKRVTDSLDMEQSTDEQIWEETSHMKDRRRKNKKKKLAYVGLAMVGGSLVLGLSGGLLAPVIGAGIAAGLSTVGITGATGFLTGVGGTTVVALSSTAIGANIGARGMSKRMGSVRTFEFKPLHNNRRVNLIVSISGWIIGNEDDVRLPFSTVDPVEGDLYSLYWEPEMLKSTGQTINIVASEVFTQTIQQVLGATILTAFMASIQWPMALSKLGYIIDNPWNVSLDRAWSAGLILADTLINRNLGQRPVTLIGFSLGARVIYSCLIELCKKKALGLVENVYIFGTPVVRKKEQLVMARSVVSGRFINGYSAKDWVLAYLFRATAGGFNKVMGISTADDVEGIEDFNCTELVDGHMAYRKNMPKLLKKIGMTVIKEEFVEIEETMDPEQAKRHRKLVNDVDAAQRKLSEGKKHSGWMPKWMKPKKTKWQKMVVEAVEDKDLNAENNNDIKDIETVSFDASRTKKPPKDKAIVDHGALFRELEVLKKAIREDELRQSQNIQSQSITIDEENDSNNCNEPATPQLPNSATMATTPRNPNTPNSFQLLTAGRPILPDDNEAALFNGTRKVQVEYPDDI